jgi:hypothetical protein
MIHTDSARRTIATCLLPAGSASAGASVAFAAGHNAPAGLIVAVAGILITGLTALAREWFWFSALRRPARNLDRICDLAQGSAAETERLMRLLQDAENNVLTARAACTARDHSRKH